ncbi:MAG: hypothetical protein ACRENW_09415 [Thermodesulfobacteriota bacterium]
MNSKLDLVDLSFGLESNTSLWGIVFKGFDEEVTLISRFQGGEQCSIETLQRFGNIIMEKYRDCTVELTKSGIVIKKNLPTNDLTIIREWSELMYHIKEEIANIIERSRD